MIPKDARTGTHDPSHSCNKDLKVPESDIAEVGLGDGGELVLSSLPNESFAFTVEKITPVSVAEEGKNTFRVEARLEDEGARESQASEFATGEGTRVVARERRFTRIEKKSSNFG